VNETKVCKECGMEYPKTPEFFHVRNRGDRRAPEYNCRCKPCHAAHMREHRRKYSNAFVISDKGQATRRRKPVATPATTWAIVVYVRYPDAKVARQIVVGGYAELRPMFDETPYPTAQEFDDAVEAWLALEPVEMEA